MTMMLRGILAFLALKLVNLTVNVATFPVLTQPSTPRRRTVSLLVPMRDEVTRLAGTLPSIAAQDVEELIVLDDGSTDGSAELARSITAGSSHVRVVAGAPRPPGWAGKTWACHQLAGQARGDVLMFCDADVFLRPGAVAAVLAQMRRQHADLMSVFPRQQTRTWGEQLLVPLVDDLLLCFLPFPLLGVDVPSAATANGSLMAFDRAAYDATGGFAAVRAEVVEDVALARQLRRSGAKLGLALGGTLVETRMYDGYRAAVVGFGRGLLPVAGGSRAALAGIAVGNLLAYSLPLLLCRRHPGWAVALLAAVVERLVVEAKTGRRCWWQAGLGPLSAVAALPVYAQAMRRSQSWRGRVYAQ